MALRKFSKHMKIVTVIVIFAFAFSAAYAGYTNLVMYFENRKEVMLTFDNYKIYKDTYEKQLNELKKQVEKFGNIKDLPDSFYTQAALSSVLDEAIQNEISTSLKIKVSSSSINEEVSKLEKQYGGRDNLAVLLAKNRSNLTILKEQIRKELLVRNTINKLKESIKPNDEVLNSIYKRYKYIELDGKPFEEVKNKVENIYYSKALNLLFHTNMDRILLEGKIETKDENIIKAFDELKTKDIVYKDMYLTKKDLLNEYFIQYLINKSYSKELNENVIKNKLEELKKLEEIENIAKSKGLEGINGLNAYDTARYYKEEYFDYLVNNYNPTEEEMLKYFNDHKYEYDIQNTISGDIIGVTYKPSEEDYKAAKEEIEKIKKEATDENFSELAKKYSQDPGSAKNGGDLGWANIRQYVPEFSILVDYKPGDIVGPIKTQFGYHLVYVVAKDKEDVNIIHLKQILIRPTISEATKLTYQKEVKELAKDLEDKKITLNDVMTNKDGKYSQFDISTTFKDITRNSSLPVVGYNQKLLDKLFALKIDDSILENLENSTLLIEKTSEIPFKEATFKDSKDKVRTQLGIEYANETLKK